MTPIQIGVVMGSSSDWDTMQHAVQILTEFGIAHEAKVVSAHRMPDAMFAYAEAAAGRGLRRHHRRCRRRRAPAGHDRPAKTTVPVLGVPVASKHLQGVDSLHSIVQMPKGIPVATFAIGAAGAANAALFAVALLAHDDPRLREQLDAWRARQTEAARAQSAALSKHSALTDVIGRPATVVSRWTAPPMSEPRTRPFCTAAVAAGAQASTLGVMGGLAILGRMFVHDGAGPGAAGAALCRHHH